jgi:hypothetical protein
MIIVDSPLTSAVAGTGSNCARGVRGTDDQILIYRPALAAERQVVA